MGKIIRHYATSVEAQAFVDGIEYVNDPEFTAKAPYQLAPGVWAVEVIDREADDAAAEE